MILSAPAKLNLCLFVGPPRDDGLHEIRSLFEPISLADQVEVTEAPADRVVCPEVGGENLAARALAGLRERGWDHAPVRVEISKRIPVAGGLGGGSADPTRGRGTKTSGATRRVSSTLVANWTRTDGAP